MQKENKKSRYKDPMGFPYHGPKEILEDTNCEAGIEEDIEELKKIFAECKIPWFPANERKKNEL